jgi:hypothetical protein
MFVTQVFVQMVCHAASSHAAQIAQDRVIAMSLLSSLPTFPSFPGRKDGEPDKSAYVMNRVPTEKMELQRQHNFSSDATLKQTLDCIGDVGPGQFKVDVGMEATIGDQAGQNTKIL